MLLDPKLDQYLLEIEQMLRTLDDCYVEIYEELLTQNRINLRLRIRIGDNSL